MHKKWRRHYFKLCYREIDAQNIIMYWWYSWFKFVIRNAKTKKLLHLFGQIHNKEEFSFPIFVPQRLERAKLQPEIGSKRWFCAHKCEMIIWHFQSARRVGIISVNSFVTTVLTIWERSQSHDMNLNAYHD